jgi:hypothetical protein
LAYSRSPGKRKQDEGEVPSAGKLYERACKADPHPEAFQAWLDWARKQGPWQVADNVAEEWRKAGTADIQPLLYLMESAEKRSAFGKSLKYLEEAEQLDRLNPEVRRTRLRLLLSAALRHLQQRKTDLALGEIGQIETVPEVRPGEIAALAAALRWCAAVIDGDKAIQDEQEACLKTSMGSVAAHLLMETVAEKADRYPAAWMMALSVSRLAAEELLAGVAKARSLGEWAGLHIALLRKWIDPLIASLKRPNCPLELGQMLVLGEAALEGYSLELGYTVSTAGLAKGGANAEFLFLRARSVPPWASLRREGCITASLELARRERNTGLAGRILDHLNPKKDGDRKRRRLGSGVRNDPTIASRAVSPELLGKILEEEQTLQQFPAGYKSPEPKYAEDLAASSCDCPRCRARRGEPVEDVEFSDEEDDFDEDEDDFDDDDDFDEDENVEAFDGAPPPGLKQMAKLLELMLSSGSTSQKQAMLKQLKKAEANGESPIDAIRRIVGTTFAKSGSSANSRNNEKEKAANVPPPGQGSLF